MSLLLPVLLFFPLLGALVMYPLRGAPNVAKKVAMGTALIEIVFAAITWAFYSVPAAQAGMARSSVAVATHMGGIVTEHAQTAFADGMHLALLITAGIVVAAAIAVATLLRPSAPAKQR